MLSRVEAAVTPLLLCLLDARCITIRAVLSLYLFMDYNIHSSLLINRYDYEMRSIPRLGEVGGRSFPRLPQFASPDFLILLPELRRTVEVAVPRE